MKSLKKATQDFIGTTTQSIKSGLSPLISHINQKWRLQGRIRLTNRWAAKNPKKFLASFLIIMGLIISTDIIVTSFIKKDHEKNPFSDVAKVDNVFNGMRQIENNRENIKMYFSKMIDDGINLNNKLDSINKIENKSHTDSLEMQRIIAKLNVISNILSNEKN